MMAPVQSLPPHIATHDEPIAVPRTDPVDPIAGPDMRTVASIEQMIDWLDNLVSAEPRYIALWMGLIRSIGCNVFVGVENADELVLMLNSPVDIQVRHRSRWAHFLIMHLDQIEDRHDALCRALTRTNQTVGYLSPSVLLAQR